MRAIFGIQGNAQYACASGEPITVLIITVLSVLCWRPRTYIAFLLIISTPFNYLHLLSFITLMQYFDVKLRYYFIP